MPCPKDYIPYTCLEIMLENLVFRVRNECAFVNSGFGDPEYKQISFGFNDDPEIHCGLLTASLLCMNTSLSWIEKHFLLRAAYKYTKSHGQPMGRERTVIHYLIHPEKVQGILSNGSLQDMQEKTLGFLRQNMPCASAIAMYFSVNPRSMATLLLGDRSLLKKLVSFYFAAPENYDFFMHRLFPEHHGAISSFFKEYPDLYFIDIPGRRQKRFGQKTSPYKK